MGQSRISTHLAQLKQAGLVEDRRTGKSSLYRMAPTTADEPDALNAPYSPGEPRCFERARLQCANNGAKDSRPLGPEGSSPDGDGFLNHLLVQAKSEIPEVHADQAAMRRVLRKRQDKMRSFFDSVAGRFGKDYVPGKSWKSVAEALLRLMPPMIIADLGAGEGAFALLLAERAKKVIAVDTSAKMIEVARDQARRLGVDNLEYRLGDMEELPIDSDSVDLVFFSQSLHHALHPERAVSEANRILVPGGRIVILDLAKHRFEEARELYADEWLGFTETDLETMLEKSAFTEIQTSVVHKDPEPPNFQTLLAVATKPDRAVS